MHRASIHWQAAAKRQPLSLRRLLAFAWVQKSEQAAEQAALKMQHIVSYMVHNISESLLVFSLACLPCGHTNVEREQAGHVDLHVASPIVACD